MKAKKRRPVLWDEIFAALEKGRIDLSVGDPAVNAVADNFRPPDGPSDVPSSGTRDPWAVLVSTILSLRTKDEVTVEASKRLLEKAPGPAELALLKEDKIARLAYPAGFYRTKAASLKKIAAILLEQYGGKVPKTMDALLALPGVGRKTANLVLTEAFDLDGICVDIHVHRISNRCGWLSGKNPEETEMILREILPLKYWKRINYLLVLYGQNLCRPVSPFCSRCVIEKHCTRTGVDRAR